MILYKFQLLLLNGAHFFRQANCRSNFEIFYSQFHQRTKKLANKLREVASNNLVIYFHCSC